MLREALIKQGNPEPSSASRKVSSKLPPCAPTPGTRNGIGPDNSRISRTCSERVAPTTKPEELGSEIEALLK